VSPFTYRWRERNVRAQRMLDIQAIKFIEQRRITTKFGFTKAPVIIVTTYVDTPF
jgi:hypothetical protein